MRNRKHQGRSPAESQATYVQARQAPATNGPVCLMRGPPAGDRHHAPKRSRFPFPNSVAFTHEKVACTARTRRCHFAMVCVRERADGDCRLIDGWLATGRLSAGKSKN